MEVFEIVDGINARKALLGMTNQQISDKSGVPKSTVDRILRKDTDNPSAQTIFDIASAVSYSFSSPAFSSETATKDSQYIRHIISMYEAQIADLKRTNNQIRAEKNRVIDLLLIFLGIAVGGWICIYMVDITNPHAGWFQDQGYINISVLALAFVVVFVIIFYVLKKKKHGDEIIEKRAFDAEK